MTPLTKGIIIGTAAAVIGFIAVAMHLEAGSSLGTFANIFFGAAEAAAGAAVVYSVNQCRQPVIPQDDVVSIPSQPVPTPPPPVQEHAPIQVAAPASQPEEVYRVSTWREFLAENRERATQASLSLK